ncbi:hypothetical protein [Streptomyces sp. NPDC056255]|uniref:hypothetical protein n=1 Tax=Streptomyces sp. NPDC056255 TaxID=3345764 RepID=UPI0035D8CCF6
MARALDVTRLTGTGTAIGTPGFMSPEQAEDGQISLASDVFSLGAVLAFAATGSEPFGQGPQRQSSTTLSPVSRNWAQCTARYAP